MKSLQRTFLTTVLLAVGASAPAQMHGGGGPGGGPGGGGPGGMGGPRGGGMSPFNLPGGMDRQNGRGMPPMPGANSTSSTMRGGLQLGPPGRFWNDRSFAQTLGLRKDQQKKMDAIFGANKTAIVESYKAYQKEEKRLEAATKEKHLDEAKIFASIDAVVQARGTMEKANAHMLLLIRSEMDPDQLARMERFREGPVEEPVP
jgi:Spy/CpxP family protein refolding chaperone